MAGDQRALAVGIRVAFRAVAPIRIAISGDSLRWAVVDSSIGYVMAAPGRAPRMLWGARSAHVADELSIQTERHSK